MNDSFMLPLLPEAILKWGRLLEIMDIVLHAKEYPRFGSVSFVPLSDFPDLNEVASEYGFRDRLYLIAMSKAMPEIPIHVDGEPGNANSASVNWPLLNCDERSPTEWYEVHTPHFKKIQSSYFLKNVEDARLIHSEAMLTRLRIPYLFRSDVLHRGYSNIEGARVLLKWELKFASWQEAVTDFERRGILAATKAE